MFRIYLELGAWDLVLFLALPSALCFLGMAIPFAEIAPTSHHLLVYQKFDYLTLIFTLITLKSSCGTGLLRKVKSSELGFAEFSLLH
jgi:hypothetical protein